MPRPIQEPIITETKFGTQHDHPAFGMIGASWVQGAGTILPGSDFKHQNFVVLTIHQASLNRNLSEDRWHGRQEIISVALSAVQWATMISSLNVGDGVPCKIEHVEGKSTPEIPYREPHNEFKTEMSVVLNESITKLDELIAMGSLTKAKLDALRSIRQDLVSNLPFVQDQFNEHVETTVERAKIEVNAYVTQAMQQAGLTAHNPQLLIDKE